MDKGANHIVVDIEASCWKGWENRNLMEIIEIGAIRIDHTFDIVSEFVTFIRPIKAEKLTPFCTQLTSITQDDVDGAPYFPEAYQLFLNWIGQEPFVWYSWGGFDASQLKRDILYHELEIDPRLENHVDLRTSYAKFKNFEKEVGLRKALKIEGIEFVGRQHRGIDDARHSAYLAQRLLRGRQEKRVRRQAE